MSTSAFVVLIIALFVLRITIPLALALGAGYGINRLVDYMGIAGES